MNIVKFMKWVVCLAGGLLLLQILSQLAVHASPQLPDLIGPGLQVTDAGSLNINWTAGYVYVNGERININAGSMAVTDNATNKIYVSPAGVVSKKTTAWECGDVPLALVVAASGDITSVTDQRAFFVTCGNLSIANSFTAKSGTGTTAIGATLTSLTSGDFLAWDGSNWVNAVASMPIKNQTGTSYAILSTDRGKLVTHSNASAVSVTLPQAGSSFPAGWFYATQNRGAGVVTITTMTSSFDGGGQTLTLKQGDGVWIVSDGTDYFTQRGRLRSHASDHQHGGVDEVATATPAANAIPKASGSGKLDSWITASSDTASGVVELATTAETSTGTDSTRGVTPAGLTGSVFGEVEVQLVVFDFTSDTATGDGKFYFIVPAKLNSMNLVRVRAEIVTAGSGGTTNVDLARCATAASSDLCSGTVADMLSTNVTIDSGENSTDTAATAAVIDTNNDDVATGQVIRVDVDAVHSTTTAKGLIVTLSFRRP